MHGQAQSAPGGQQGLDLAYELQHLGWIDVTALSVVGLFCVLGLFKGFVWQASRIAILVAGYVLAARFGPLLGAWIVPDRAAEAAANGELAHDGRIAEAGGFEPEAAEAAEAAEAMADPAAAAGDGSLSGDTATYLACAAVFLAVVVVLSLLATQLRKLVKKAGLGFFDRVCGGAFGVATGGFVVLALLCTVNMFFRRTTVARAAESSHALRLSKKALDLLGQNVPDPLRTAFALQPLQTKSSPRRPTGATPPGTVPGTGAETPGEAPPVLPPPAPGTPPFAPQSPPPSRGPR